MSNHKTAETSKDGTAGFTQGPWAIAPHSHRDETRDVVAGYEEVEEDGRTIKQAHWVCQLDAQLDFDSDVEEQYATMEANANLIASAPDLHAALKALWNETVESGNATATDFLWPSVRAKVLAALAKAEGR